MGRTDTGARGSGGMGWALTLSLVAFYVGDRWGMLASSHRDVLEGLTDGLSPDLAYEILVDPLAFSLESVPLTCGLALFVAVWYAYAYVAGERRQVRTAHEHGSGRRGTLAEGLDYRDRSNPANNIVLTDRLALAVDATGARRSATARNVLVVGPTGTGKTVGYVLPNILQLCLEGADRDMVVVDPKGTTLKAAGHALVASGVDVSVLNTQDLAQSDRYNPLAHVRTYTDVIDFVNCLLENTNDGRKSAEPIWDSGEALLYKALLTLMLDWFGPSQMTLASLVTLIDLVDVPDDASEDRCPLDLIIDEIESGFRTVADEDGDDPKSAVTRGAFETAPEPVVRVPSLLERRDGARPALGEDRGRPGLPTDPSVRAWREFRQGSSKTLRSFVISSHARLGYLTTPEVLDLLAAEDGEDELHLELLGQTEDGMGRPLPPRVVFVVSADASSALQPILAMACWQAVRLPVRAADTRCGGSLPRPLSIVLDEFANIGRIADFERMLATVRSRNVDIQIVLQSIAQLESLFERQGASNVRENAVTTVFLGGANAAYSSHVLSGEFGKTTAYKREVSRQRSDGRESVSTSESAYAADVFEEGELVRLADDRAIVRIGSDNPIEDRKAHVTRHPAYDATYMGKRPQRSFDYRAWRSAGSPRGEALAAWEDVFFSCEAPAREARDAQRQRLESARRHLARAHFRAARMESEAEADELVALHQMREDLEAARLAAREAELAWQHDRACVAAGSAHRLRHTPEEAGRLDEAARALERDLRRRVPRGQDRVVFG